MSLALTYSTNGAKVSQLIAELESAEHQGRQISSHQVDMESADDLERLFTEIQAAHGHPPDVMIANAGHGKRIPDIEDIPIEEFDKTIAVNLRAPFILAKASLPWMKQQGWGRLIFISSIAAEGGGINGCHYASSKAGLNGMMKNLARKVARFGVTVNSVAPAMIGDTGMIPNASILKGTPGDVANIPVGRLGTPQECANVVEMICQTGYMTEQNILLTGGLK
jgi:3-oxoacyl-[acyl-carrier protein] reductase